MGSSRRAASRIAAGALAEDNRPHPDAPIFGLRDRCLRLTKAIYARDERRERLPLGPEREAEWEKVNAQVRRWHATKRELAETPARTVEGIRAKAEILWGVIAPSAGFRVSEEDVLAWSICRDLLTIEKGAP
jgi:hypothetical protein